MSDITINLSDHFQMDMIHSYHMNINFILIKVIRPIINELPDITKTYVIYAKDFEEIHTNDILNIFQMNGYTLYSDPPLDSIFKIVTNPTYNSNTFDVSAFSQHTTAKWTFSAVPTRYPSSTQDAFNITYYFDNLNGINFVTFLNEQRANYDRRSYLSLYTSIVNASGVGKSRLLRQLPSQVSVLYCCLRSEDSSGFPTKSSISDELLKESKDTHPGQYVERFAAYFIASINTYVLFKNKDCYCNATPMQLFDMQGSSEYQIELIKQLHIEIKQISNSCAKYRSKYRLEALQGLAWSDAVFTHVKKCIVSKVKLNEEQLYLFVFDEARTLLNANGAAMNYTNKHLFSYLQKAFMAFDKFASKNFMGVMMDTLSRVSNFQPQDRDPSLRVFDKERKGKLKLLRPYFMIDTIDTHVFAVDVEKLLKNLSLKDHKSDGVRQMSQNDDNADFKAQNLEWIFKSIVEKKIDHIELGMMLFGRPLWFSEILGKMLEENDSVHLIVSDVVSHVKDIAYAKLLTGAKDLSYLFEHNKSFYYALISILLGARLRLSEVIAEGLISDLMAYCFYISDDRSSIMCGYSIEPILADAVAEIIKQHINGDKTTELVRALQHIVSMGYVDMGEMGELIGKLILVLAIYHCNDQNSHDPFVDSKSSMNPVTVHSFLTALLNMEDLSDIGIGKEFLNATVFFNHFYSVDNALGVDELKDYFLRCCAIFCKTNQPGVDLMLPILLQNGTMTFILIQIKLLSDATRTSIERVLGKCNPFYAKLVHHLNELKVEYISIYMQLGISKSQQAMVVNSNDLVIEIPLIKRNSKKETNAEKKKQQLLDSNLLASKKVEILNYQRSICCMGLSSLLPWLATDSQTRKELNRLIGVLKLNPLLALYTVNDYKEKNYLKSLLESVHKVALRRGISRPGTSEMLPKKKKKK